MIVAERKPFEEVKGFIDKYEKVLVVGCGTCVTVCLAGGESEVEVLGSALRIANQKEGKDQEILEDCITRQCEPEFVEALTKRVKEEGIDAVLSLGCGRCARRPTKMDWPRADDPAPPHSHPWRCTPRTHGCLSGPGSRPYSWRARPRDLLVTVVTWVPSNLWGAPERQP